MMSSISKYSGDLLEKVRLKRVSYIFIYIFTEKFVYMNSNCSYTVITTLIFSLLLMSCREKKKEEKADKDQARIEQKEEKTKVKVANARRDQFEMELVSNGKVVAKEKATLNFLVADIIDSVFVSNGSRVRRGDPIALVDGYNARQQ